MTPNEDRLANLIADHLTDLDMVETLGPILGAGWEKNLAASIVENVFTRVETERSDVVVYRSRLVARTVYESGPVPLRSGPDPHPLANCGPLRFSLTSGDTCPTCGTTV